MRSGTALARNVSCSARAYGRPVILSVTNAWGASSILRTAPISKSISTSITWTRKNSFGQVGEFTWMKLLKIKLRTSFWDQTNSILITTRSEASTSASLGALSKWRRISSWQPEKISESITSSTILLRSSSFGATTESCWNKSWEWRTLLTRKNSFRNMTLTILFEVNEREYALQEKELRN